jgi:hypothetical protein
MKQFFILMYKKLIDLFGKLFTVQIKIESNSKLSPSISIFLGNNSEYFHFPNILYQLTIKLAKKYNANIYFIYIFQLDNCLVL